MKPQASKNPSQILTNLKKKSGALPSIPTIFPSPLLIQVSLIYPRILQQPGEKPGVKIQHSYELLGLRARGQN